MHAVVMLLSELPDRIFSSYHIPKIKLEQQGMRIITKTRPCNILQFFTAVKMTILVDFFFHIFAQNIDCGYTLEPP